MSHRIGSVSATLQCGAFSLTLKKRGTVQSCHRLSFFSAGLRRGLGWEKTSGWPQASFVAAVVAAVCVHLVRRGGRATIPAVWKIGSHVGIF